MGKMYVLKLTPNGFAVEMVETPKKVRNEKGKSKIDFPSDYTVIDIETTGLSPEYDKILEIGALRVRDNKVVESFQTFVAPQLEEDEELEYYIPPYVENLTGITVDMLADAPVIDECLKSFIDFVGDDVIVGHNVNFDINFIYDNLEYNNLEAFSNDFVDTLRLSRKAFPELPKHTLEKLREAFNISSEGSHRVIADCYAAIKIYNECKNVAEKSGFDEWIRKVCSSVSKNPAASVTEGNPEKFNESSPFFDKTCVFTGTLSKMVRKDAMQMVVDIGGHVADSVTKKTNFLIMGEQDYSKFADGKESSKTKKVKALQEKGQIIHIISEEDFYQIIFGVEK